MSPTDQYFKEPVIIKTDKLDQWVSDWSTDRTAQLLFFLEQQDQQLPNDWD